MTGTSLDTFFKWRAHRERELNEPTRLELYLARMSHLLFEIPFMVWGKESKVPEEKFVIKFSYDGKPTGESVKDEEEIRASVERQVDQTYDMMESLLSAVAARERNTVDPSAGFIVQDNLTPAPAVTAASVPPPP